MRKATKRLVLGVMLLSAAACATAETPEAATARMTTEGAEAKTAIEAINARYERFMTENNADSIVALFVEDGILLPPAMPAAQGHAAIRDFMTKNGMPPGASMKFTTVAVDRNGPLAVERGTYVFSMPAMPATPAKAGTPATPAMPAMNATGKYLTHWKLVDGTWKTVSSIWNDDAPMPPMGG